MENEFSRQIFEKIFKNKISWKSVNWEPSCSMRTDWQRHNEANNRLADAPKNSNVHPWLCGYSTGQSTAYFCRTHISIAVFTYIRIWSAETGNKTHPTNFNTNFQIRNFTDIHPIVPGMKHIKGLGRFIIEETSVSEWWISQLFKYNFTSRILTKL